MQTKINGIFEQIIVLNYKTTVFPTYETRVGKLITDLGNTCVILQCLSQGKRKNNFGIKPKNKFIEYFGNIIELY